MTEPIYGADSAENDKIRARLAADRVPDPLDLPNARAVIEWWLADEYGSLADAIEGECMLQHPPEVTAQCVLAGLRELVKQQEFEDDCVGFPEPVERCKGRLGGDNPYLNAEQNDADSCRCHLYAGHDGRHSCAHVRTGDDERPIWEADSYGVRKLAAEADPSLREDVTCPDCRFVWTGTVGDCCVTCGSLDTVPADAMGSDDA